MSIGHCLLLLPAAVLDDSMMDRMVRRHRPHSEPAPQASATSLHVLAPVVTARETTSLVIPTQRHTYISARPMPEALSFAAS